MAQATDEGPALSAEIGQPATSTPGEHAQAQAPTHEEIWKPPPAEPLKIIAALLAVGAGAFVYGYARVNFWSSSALGIHDRIPYPAYILMAAGLGLTLAGLRIGLGIWSPHAKLAVSVLAFLTSAVIGIQTGLFVNYTLRGTLNPPFDLKLEIGEKFPDFSLADQDGAIHTQADFLSRGPTLVLVYRGDYCAFARSELQELTARRGEFRRAGVKILAVSADPIERSQMLARFLGTDIPLLGDTSEKLLGPLGLIQHHRGAEPDNAIPAAFIVDGAGMVRWIFTSPYYREQPAPEALLRAAAQISRPAG